MASVGRKSMSFCNRSITSEAAASDRPARRRSCGMWSSSSPRRNSGASSTSRESVTMRRTVESRRKAAITMFASTTSRRGAASDSLPRGASRGLEPTPESFLDETVERPHVLEREHASMGQGIHPLQVADSFGQKPSDDLAPLDFGTGLHLAMQFRGDGQSDIGHGLDYVRAHNQTLGEGASRASPAPGSGLRAAKTLYRTSRVRSLLNEDEGLPYEERPPRSLGYSATRLWLASALLLATNLIWLLAVALNLLGPLGPLTAGLLAWVALTLDVPGAVLLGAAYGRLRRETGDRQSILRMAIFWGFVGWASLSVYWRLLLPPLTRGGGLERFL